MANVNKINPIEPKNITAINNISANDIAKIDKSDVSFINVPQGLIVPFNDTVIPSGWTRFSAPDDRMIIGAGSTYSAGSSGGTNIPHNFNTTTGTAGLHGPVSGFYTTYPSTNNCWAASNTQSNSGDHSHTLTNVTYNPDKRSCVLIKANAEYDTLPAKAMLFSMASSQSGLTNISDFNNRYIESKSSIANIDEVKSIAVGTAGSHTHGHQWRCFGGFNENNVAYYVVNPGNHTPTLNLTSVTDNLKKVLLSLWTHATQSFEPNSNMIAMYEGTTAPDGWKLCDGLNSTPDLRDCFIKPVSSGSENSTPSGDNTVDLVVPTGNMTHNASHTHGNTTYSSGYQAAWHKTYAWSHSHSLGLSNVSDIAWVPPYYALSFVMKD